MHISAGILYVKYKTSYTWKTTCNKTIV